MEQRQDSFQDETDELLVDDEALFFDDDHVEDNVEDNADYVSRSQQLKMNLRRRIEDRLEQRSLMRELDDYSNLDMDDGLYQ